jgi:phosphatidate cytidylyltransferase
MRKRLLLGPVLIAVLLLGFWLDEWVDRQGVAASLRSLFPKETYPPGVVTFLVCLVLSVIASRELAVIFKSKGIGASRRVMTTCAILGLLVSCLVPTTTPGPAAAAVVSTAAVIVLAGSLTFYSRRRTVEGVIAAAGGALLSFVYLGLMFGFVLAIRREHSAWVLAWVLMTTKLSDIGAYFTGTAIGRHKLIPWLSPGKTWEGLVGGVVAASIGGGVLAHLLLRSGVRMPIEPASAALAGAIFGIVGQIGDLMASLFKRDAGQKDSGRILPGFGGLLDVLDSPLLVLPVAFWWLAAS